MAAPSPDQSIADLLSRSLQAAGVTRVFGAPSSDIVGIPGLRHLRVDDPVLAALLADAHGRVTGGAHPGAALLPGGRLRVGSQPGLAVDAVTVSDAHLLPELIAAAGHGPGFNAVELVLDLDLDAPAPDDVEPVTFGPSGRHVTLSPTLADLGLIVLAGSGVVRAGATEALRTFAAQTGLLVATTLGAVGVLPADDPQFAGVVGVQDEDFALAGITEAPVVVAVGVDPAEAPADRWAHRQVLEVEPAQLGALAYNWPAPEGPAPVSPLRDALDELVATLGRQSSVPLTPARAVVDLVATRPRGSIITADPGPAALWFARAAALDDPSSVALPAVGLHGFAVAGAMAAALDERPAIAVTTHPFDAVTEALLELAGLVGSRFTIVEWGADVEWAEATAHRAALRTAFGTTASATEPADGITHVPVPVDLALTRALFDAVGPATAWQPSPRPAYDWRDPS